MYLTRGGNKKNFGYSCDGKTPGKRPRLDSNSHDVIPEQSLIPSNKNLTEVIKILKPNIKQLVEDTNAVSKIY